MNIFRKLKKLVRLHLLEDDDMLHSSHVHQHRRNDEVPPVDMSYGPLPKSFFNAVNSSRQVAGYDQLPIRSRGASPIPEEYHVYEDPDAVLPKFERRRSNSRDRSVPHHLPGTPTKYRRRPISPELFQMRDPSPFHFRQHSLPSSPELHRHFQQQQHPQINMMMGYPPQFHPQFQQPFYPMNQPNAYPWFMMSQPQMPQFF